MIVPRVKRLGEDKGRVRFGVTGEARARPGAGSMKTILAALEQVVRDPRDIPEPSAGVAQAAAAPGIDCRASVSRSGSALTARRAAAAQLGRRREDLEMSRPMGVPMAQNCQFGAFTLTPMPLRLQKPRSPCKCRVSQNRGIQGRTGVPGWRNLSP